MNTETPQHTPTPWRRVIGFAGDGSAGSQSEQICNAENVGVVLLQHDGSDEGNANVERIVLCVNSHERLVNACELVQRAWVGDGVEMSRAVDECLLALAAAQPTPNHAPE